MELIINLDWNQSWEAIWGSLNNLIKLGVLKDYSELSFLEYFNYDHIDFLGFVEDLLIFEKIKKFGWESYTLKLEI